MTIANNNGTGSNNGTGDEPLPDPDPRSEVRHPATEVPHPATEVPHGATEVPRGATEMPVAEARPNTAARPAAAAANAPSTPVASLANRVAPLANRVAPLANRVASLANGDASLQNGDSPATRLGNGSGANRVIDSVAPRGPGTAVWPAGGNNPASAHDPDPANNIAGGAAPARAPVVPTPGADTAARAIRDEAAAHAQRVREAADRSLGEAEELARQTTEEATAIRDQAETRARQTTEEATADAERVRREAPLALADAEVQAQQAAEALRDEAETRARQITAEANTDARAIRQTADGRARQITDEADTAARAIRDEAETRARLVAEEADTAARTIRDEAAAAASRLREETERDRERVLHEARTLAESEAARIVADAEADATRLRSDAELAAGRLREEAEVEGQRIRETAEFDRGRIVEEARAQAYFEANHIRDDAVRQARQVRTRMQPTTTPIHSAEITARDFPRAVRGYDPQAVSKWLALVEQSYTLVEDELERRRVAADEFTEALADVRRRVARAAADPVVARAERGPARVAWTRALDAAGSGLGSTRLGFDTLAVRTALLEAPLRRRLLGYSRSQVRRLLEASAGQLARLENQLHLTHAENERVRAMVLENLGDTGPAELGTGTPAAVAPEPDVAAAVAPNPDVAAARDGE